MDNEKRAELKQKLERIKALKQENYLGTSILLDVIKSEERTLNAASSLANLINDRISDLEFPVTAETIGCLSVLNSCLYRLEGLLPKIQLREREDHSPLSKREIFDLDLLLADYNLDLLLADYDYTNLTNRIEFFTYCKTRQVKSTKDCMKEFVKWYFEDLKKDKHFKILEEHLPEVESSPEYNLLINEISEFQMMDARNFSEIYKNLLKQEVELNSSHIFWSEMINNVLNDNQDKDPRYRKQIIDMYLDNKLGYIISEMGNTDISLDFDERDLIYHGNKELTIYRALLVYTKRSRDKDLRFEQESSFDVLRQSNQCKKIAYEFLEKVLVQEKNYVLGRIKHGKDFPEETLNTSAIVRKLNPFSPPETKD